MIDSVAKLLGSGFVVPTLALLLVAWASKFLFDLHVSSRQSRKDFLDAWPGIDLNDAVLVETTVRHLWGTYLPAEVIRAVRDQSFPTFHLRRLSIIWDQVDYDSNERRIHLKSRWMKRAGLRRAAYCGYTALYFLFGMSAFYHGRQTVLQPPSAPLAWLLVAVSFGSGVLAFVSLGRADRVKSLDVSSMAMIEMLNRRLGVPAASQGNVGNAAPPIDGASVAAPALAP